MGKKNNREGFVNFICGIFLVTDFKKKEKICQ
jgi:hypothetical protein